MPGGESPVRPREMDGDERPRNLGYAPQLLLVKMVTLGQPARPAPPFVPCPALCSVLPAAEVSNPKSRRPSPCLTGFRDLSMGHSVASQMAWPRTAGLVRGKARRSDIHPGACVVPVSAADLTHQLSSHSRCSLAIPYTLGQIPWNRGESSALACPSSCRRH